MENTDYARSLVIPYCSYKHKMLFTTFRFTSLIKVSSTFSLYAFRASSLKMRFRSKCRLVAKRSYLLFAWLRYLTINHQRAPLQQCVHVVMLPATNSFYTITKAPMAHKTRSKEQLLFKFYHFIVTFRSFQLPVISSITANSANRLARTLWITRRLFPFFETNLVFLKYYQVRYPLQDKYFFIPKFNLR
jgi:hypothetical protein